MASGLDRLLAQLNNTGLQNKDTPLYQVIASLITRLKELESLLSGSGSSGNTVINNFLKETIFIESGEGGGDGEMGPPGERGADGTGTGAMVPYYIAPDETFTVPEFSQALFAMNIDNEGILDVEGFLIEVD